MKRKYQQTQAVGKGFHTAEQAADWLNTFVSAGRRIVSAQMIDQTPTHQNANHPLQVLALIEADIEVEDDTPEVTLGPQLY